MWNIMGMSDEMNDLLSLLALMIFVDKHVYKNEIKAFVRLANKLQVAREIEPLLSEASLSQWYEDNKSEIRGVMKRPEFEAWFMARLDGLKDLPNKLSVLGVLCDIASADGVVHISETALIKLTAMHWDIAV